jgi:KDO2-lipid IV(A) lauroyltransferase
MPKRRNRTRSKTLDYLVYLAVRLFSAIVHMFPVETNYRTARWIGDVFHRLDGRHRRIAEEHIRRSFPDWPEQRVRRAAKRSMRAMVYLGLEVLLTTRLVQLIRHRELFDYRNVAGMLDRLIRRQRGVILLTGHYGNWEVVGYAMAELGFPTYSVARRMDNPYLDDYILGVRQREGQVILDKRGATQRVPDLLEAREAVGFIADQDAGRKGCFVEFFGRKASTYKSIALLAIRYEVPVAVGYARRLAERFRFEIGIERLIEPDEWAGRDDPVAWITQEYTSALERTIRREPEQYLWVHRRWKHRPKGEPQAEGGIA